MQVYYIILLMRKIVLVSIILILLGVLTITGFFYLENKYTTWRGGDSLTASLIRQTSTDESESFTFAVIGDSEEDADILNPVFKKSIGLIEDSEADFMIHLGDFTNQGRKIEYDKINLYLKENLSIPINFVPGNHDIAEDPANKTLFLENAGKLFRSFNHQDHHFVILDNSNPQVGFSVEQLDWLKFDLEENKDKFVFIFFHRPIDVPFVKYFSLASEESETTNNNNERLKEIISGYQINEIYCGHIHSYFTYNLGGGVPLTITGGGGSKPNLSFLDNARSFNHFILVEVKDGDHYNRIVEVN